MGVYHISGLGIHPGAVTVPLTYIYLALSNSKDFELRKVFEYSGEKGEKGGMPESLVLFTSSEIIEGKITIKVRDKWFNIGKNKISDIIRNYLGKLTEKLGLPPIKNIYLVQVDYQDFDDCFEKAYITFNALRDKEMWVNMVAGSNVINASLLISSLLQGAVARYYYVFQEEQELLHPDIELSPISYRTWSRVWCELPLFTMDIGEIIHNLLEEFKYREKINIGELKNLLGGIPLEKARGNLVYLEGEVATKGPLLRYWEGIEDLKEKSKEITNLTKWERWGEENNIIAVLE